MKFAQRNVTPGSRQLERQTHSQRHAPAVWTAKCLIQLRIDQLSSGREATLRSYSYTNCAKGNVAFTSTLITPTFVDIEFQKTAVRTVTALKTSNPQAANCEDNFNVKLSGEQAGRLT